MVKVTLILVVLAFVSIFVLRFMVASLSDEEKVVLHFSNIAPMRVNIAVIIMLLLWIAAIICGLISIIMY